MSGAGHWISTRVFGRTNWNQARSLVTDVALKDRVSFVTTLKAEDSYIDICVNKVLRGNDELGRCSSERSPVLGCVNIEEPFETTNSVNTMHVPPRAITYDVSCS